jgi:hypothetical protein
LTILIVAFHLIRTRRAVPPTPAAVPDCSSPQSTQSTQSTQRTQSDLKKGADIGA